MCASFWLAFLAGAGTVVLASFGFCVLLMVIETQAPERRETKRAIDELIASTTLPKRWPTW